MTFRVMAGFSAIWAGNAKETKDGAVVTMPGKRYIVTDDVLAAAAIWLDGKPEHTVYLPDRKITLKAITEYREEAKE